MAASLIPRSAPAFRNEPLAANARRAWSPRTRPRRPSGRAGLAGQSSDGRGPFEQQVEHRFLAPALAGG